MGTVTFDAGAGGRLDAAENTGAWSADGVSPAQEPDFVYHGTYSISAKIKTTEAGYYCTTASTDMTTPKVWLCKILATNKDALTGVNLRVRIGSSTSAYYYYELFSPTTYPIAGGWQIVPIDPNVSAYRTGSSGTPSLSGVTIFYLRADFSTTAKSENVALDAIDVITSGTGLTVTGSSSVFQDFIDFDEGTYTNRYGIVTTKGGVLFITGVLTIGSATATAFDDSYQTLVFPTGRFSTGFCGVDVSLANASTDVALASCTLIGRGSLNYLSSGQDTRPDFTVTNTSGVFAMDACTLINFRALTFTSTCTITDSSFVTSLSLTQAQATFDNCTFDSPTNTTSNAFITAVDPSDFSNCSFISGGAGHALELTSASGSPFTFDGNTFSGYSGTPGSNLTPGTGSNDAAIFNNSGTDITINLTNTSSIPSVRNAASCTTTINNNVTYTITVQDEGASVIVGAQVAMFKTSDDSVLHASSATNASGQVTGSVAASTGAIYIRVRQSNTADSTRYYPTSTVGNIGTTAFTVTVTMIEDITVI
jgi:hypothetical protein